MDWNGLRIFHAAAQTGSFTAAGKLLNMSQSAVSRHVAGLEEALNAPLFHRHARGIMLTEHGELLQRAADEILDRIEYAQAQIKDSHEIPRGELRLTTTMAFGSTWLIRQLRDFIETYPEIRIQLLLADAELDLSMREADVAIRFRRPHQPDLVCRKLMTVHNHPFASIDYLKRHGTPASAADLDRHHLIAYGPDVPRTLKNINWLLTAGAPAPRTPVLEANSMHAIYQAAEGDLGIAALPAFLAEGSPRLKRILPNIEGPSLTSYFVYPEALRQSKRVLVVRDFLIARAQNPVL